MEPVISFALFTSITYMTNACNALREKCVDGITANADHTQQMVMQSIGIVTQLNPIIGYEKSAAIAREALETGKSVHDIAVKEKKLVTQEKWDEIFTFENMIRPNISSTASKALGRPTPETEFDISQVNTLPKADILYDYSNKNPAPADALVKDKRRNKTSTPPWRRSSRQCFSNISIKFHIVKHKPKA